MRLAGQERVEWTGRAHFFGIAAQAMLTDPGGPPPAAGPPPRGGGENPAALLDIHHWNDWSAPWT